MGFAGKAAIEDTSNWVFIYLKNMGEFEDECTSFVLFEVKATSEGVQARDWEGLMGLAEKEVLEFEDFAKLLLDFHVVVIAVIANTLELLGNGGGLRHGSRPSEASDKKRHRFEGVDR